MAQQEHISAPNGQNKKAIDWEETESLLRGADFPVPLYYRAAWMRHNTASSYQLIPLHHADGSPLGGAAVQLDTSRTLPGHRFARVLRFGEGLSEEAIKQAAAAFADFARGDSSILRMTVSVFSRSQREEIGRALREQGFVPCESTLSYRHTLIMDLLPDESGILAALDKKARRDLREVEKAVFRVHALTSAEFADRLAALESEARDRSGGSFRMQNWKSLLQLSREQPHLSRVAGLFLPESSLRPEDLVAFAWGCMHGSHGEYRAGGTARLPDNRLSLSAPLLWDLCLWAREQGASWFDLGGVTLATGEGEDALSGISSFKRRFSREVAEVGEDWYIEPHPLRAQAAALLGKVARNLAGAARAIRGGR